MSAVRVDLQVEGGGARGHRMLIDEEWGTIRSQGVALATVHKTNVTCEYTIIPGGETTLSGTFKYDPVGYTAEFVPAPTKAI